MTCSSTSPKEREAILNGLEQSGELSSDYARRGLTLTFDEIRRQGFASIERCQHNANPGKTSSMAAPIMLDGECRGTLTLTVFASVMSVSDAIARFSGTLLATATSIADVLASGGLAGSQPCACARNPTIAQ